jgi:O-antigen/teichoic acid export membrane protein
MSKVRRATLLIVGSQVLGQLSLMAVIPFLTRIFSPGEMGLYQLATAVALLVQPIATLRLEFVIPTSADVSTANRRQRVGMVTVLTLTTVTVASGLSCLLLGEEVGAEVSFMAALLLLAYGWMVLDNSQLIRSRQTNALAARNAISGIVAACLQVCLTLWIGEVWTLAASLLVARLIAILVTSPRGRKTLHPSAAAANLDDSYGPGRAIPTILAGLLSGLTLQGLTLISTASFGVSYAGQVGIAQRVAATPISLLGQGLSQSTQAAVAPIIRARKPVLVKRLSRQVVPLALIAALMALCLIVLGPVLAVPILGEGWQIAGYIMAIMAIPVSMQLVVSPIDFVLIMLRREKVLLGLQMLRAVITIGSGVVVASLTDDPLLAIAAFSTAWAGAYLTTIFTVFHYARAFDQENSRNV